MGGRKVNETETCLETDINDKDSSIMRDMAHEIRTQMNSIVSLSFLLKDNSLNEIKKNDLVNHIHMTCRQLITVFENFSELESNIDKNIKKEEERCNIANLFTPLFDEFRSLLITSGKKGIELIHEIQGSSLHEVIINKGVVSKIIYCLFSNSLQNTEYGYIKIGFYKSTKYLTFYVLDTGNGYAKTKEFFTSEDIKSSLEQFNDLYSAINIFLAKKFVHALNGSVEIKYNGANGSGTYFTIPVREDVIKSQSFFSKYFKLL